MPTETTEATSAAQADAPSTEPANLTLDQGAQRLFENIAKHQAAEEKPKPAPAAEEEKPAPEPEPESETVPDSEAESAETSTEEQETATEEESETDLSHRTLDQKTKEKIQRRIDKEVAKRKALESRITELESSLQEKAAEVEKKPVPVVDVTNQPLANITDMSKLSDLKRSAKEAIRWAEEQLDSEAILNGDSIKVGETTYDRKALKDVMRHARVTLEDHIPMREQFLNQQGLARAAALKEFPFLTDKSTPEYQMAQAARNANPWLNSLPNADWIIAVQVEGIKAIEERKKAAKAKAEAPTKPKTPPAKPSSDQAAVSTSGGTPARAPAATGSRQAIAAEKAKFEAKGGITAGDAAEYLQRISQLRNSR
jgi:hypothetical protein